MQIKKFEAGTMSDALRMVKKEFGSEAVILSARSLHKENRMFGLLKKPGVEVTAATDSGGFQANTAVAANGDSIEARRPEVQRGVSGFRHERGHAVGRFPDRSRGGYASVRGYGSPVVEDGADEWSALLRRLQPQELETSVMSQLIDSLKRRFSSGYPSGPDELERGMDVALSEVGIRCEPFTFGGGDARIAALVGPTGVGKTTTIAKLAATHSLRTGRDTALISLDHHRIGGIDQLRIYADIIGIPLFVARDNKSLRAALNECRDVPLVLIDTPGMSQKNTMELRQLRKALERVENLEVHLVLSSTTKDSHMRDVIQRFGILRYDKLMFTKLDEGTSFGTIVNQLVRTGVPVSHFLVGQHVPEDIRDGHTSLLASLLLGHNSGQAPSMPEPSGDPAVVSGPRKGRQAPSSYYVANSNSDVVHRSDCMWAKRIKKENMIVFDSVSEAMYEKYTPCCLCDPGSVK